MTGKWYNINIFSIFVFKNINFLLKLHKRDDGNLRNIDFF